MQVRAGCQHGRNPPQGRQHSDKVLGDVRASRESFLATHGPIPEDVCSVVVSSVVHDNRYEVSLENPFPVVKFNSDRRHQEMLSLIESRPAN